MTAKTEKTEAKPKPKLAVAKASDDKAASAAVAKHAATANVAVKKGRKKGDGEAARAADDAKKITVMFKEIPAREGTLAHKTRTLYKDGITVAEWREACKTKGGDAGYLRHDISKGYIKLT